MSRQPADILGDWQIFFFLGMAGLFAGGFFLLIGLILYFVAADSGIWKMFLFGFAPLGLIPGIVLMYLGIRKRGPVRQLEELAELLKTYRRIKVAKVAQKLGVTEFEAEKRIAACVDRGFVKGHIDRATEEFFTIESVGQVVQQEGCPNCGAPPDRLVLVGEQQKCSNCGTVISRGRGA